MLNTIAYKTSWKAADRMMTHKNKSRKNIPLWCIPCLLMAGALFAVEQLGGGEMLRNVLSQIAGNPTFVETTLSSEVGAVGWESVSTHDPGNVSISDVVSTTSLPDDLTNTQTEIDTEAEHALVHESQFTPPANVQKASHASKAPTKTLSGAPIKPLTITGKNGGYTGQNGVFVQNQSGLSFDLPSMFTDPAIIQRNASKDQPTVMILHTHGSEAYVDQKGERSEDPEHSVVHIGDILTDVLESKGIGVVHCRTIIDKPSYNQSYNRALDIIEAQMKKTPSLKVIIDLHRDSMITSSGTEYKIVSEIDGETCCQMMLVIGTNAGGLNHPNWKKNLNFAANLQKNIVADYPTLMRPINLRKQRFNEHVTTGSMILECGSSANTIEEAEIAIRAFGEKLAQTLK